MTLTTGIHGEQSVAVTNENTAKTMGSGTHHDEIGKMAPFVNYADEVVNPLFIWYLKPEYARAAKWRSEEIGRASCRERV